MMGHVGGDVSWLYYDPWKCRVVSVDVDRESARGARASKPAGNPICSSFFTEGFPDGCGPAASHRVGRESAPGDSNGSAAGTGIEATGDHIRIMHQLNLKRVFPTRKCRRAFGTIAHRRGNGSSRLPVTLTLRSQRPGEYVLGPVEVGGAWMDYHPIVGRVTLSVVPSRWT